MIQIQNYRVTSTEGRIVHRLGTDQYAHTMTVLAHETTDNFEEVDAKPAPTVPDDYDERVDALIRERYTLSQELAVLRQRDTKPDEFASYNDYAEQCKARAKGGEE